MEASELQTLAQEARAIQSFEDARLAEYLERQAEEEDGELRTCGNCGLATPLDESDSLTVQHLLETTKRAERMRHLIDRALRACVWCDESRCLMRADDDACTEWIHYAECED